MENFYATNYTNRKRYYLSFLLLASFYLCISFAFLADILFPNLCGIKKSFSEFIFNIGLFAVIAILVTIAQVCFYVTTNFYVKKISLNDDRIYIILFSGKNYNINLIDIESFDTKFSRFWGWEYFLYKHKNGKTFKIITEINNKEYFVKKLLYKIGDAKQS